MAFVIEEERKFEFNNEREKFQVGPGQYLPLTENKLLRANPVPFESSSSKLKDKPNGNPGPGSYYVDHTTKEYDKVKDNEKILMIEHQAMMMNKNKSAKEHEVITEMKNAKARLRVNYEKLGFSVKEKRFMDNPLSSPLGPGDYIDNPETQKDQRSMSAKCSEIKNKVVKLQPGQIKGPLDHIPSIPPKETFGFAIDNCNKVILKGNPDNYKYFSGLNGDTVGPGSYDVDFPEQWHRTGTNWSKFKTYRVKKQKPFSVTCSDSLKHNDKIKLNSLQNNSGAFNKLSLKQLMKKDMENKAKTKMSVNKPNTQPTTPGPGYYFDIDLHSGFQQVNPYDQGVFFGTKSNRFNQLSFEDDSQCLIGPGSYFTNRHSKQLTTKSTNNDKKSSKKVPFSSLSNRFSSTTQSSSSLPGPGSYASEALTSSKHFNKTSSAFYAHQKRFIENQQEIERIKQIPGPGSYLDAYSNTGTSDTVELNGRYLNSRKAQDLSRKRSESASKASMSSTTKAKSTGASVGEYDPGFPMTIEFQNLQKSRIHKSEVAFNSSCPQKFIQHKEQYIVGPGSYGYSSYVDYNQRMIPFNHATSRHPTVLNSHKIAVDKNIGPGKYNYDEVYSWKKKSFNVKYI